MFSFSLVPFYMHYYAHILKEAKLNHLLIIFIFCIEYCETWQSDIYKIDLAYSNFPWLVEVVVMWENY